MKQNKHISHLGGWIDTIDHRRNKYALGKYTWLVYISRTL